MRDKMEYKFCILMMSMECFFFGSHGQDTEPVAMTILSVDHFNSGTDSLFQCRLTPPDNDPNEVTVESLRTGWTRNTANENIDPPPVVYTKSGRRYHRVNMYNYGNNSAFGVFGCNATKNGKKDTIISTTRMRSDADIVPENGLFTQTVSIGDRNVNISMSLTTGDLLVKDLRWRNNTYLWPGTKVGVDTFTIDEPVQLYHAGIYECYRQGDRASAKHGLNLLIVRACPHMRWGPPDCEGVCDSCYNGGVCDENTGRCVCAPGFTGMNCLTACGGNRYGYDCEQQCTYRGDPKDRCGGRLFCLVHPFGCRCNTGFKGLDCTEACNENTFGASCLQSCHCASNQCDRYTGVCQGTDTSCDPGFTGASCQECVQNTFGASCMQSCHCSSDQCNRYTGKCEGMDTSCDPGWTGEFCQDDCYEGYFGSGCEQECHCSPELCNRESGQCQSGGCLPQWADIFPPHHCQTGLESATFTRVNPNVAVPVNCTAVQGPGGDLTGFDVVLSRSMDRVDKTDITLENTFLSGTTITSHFSLKGGEQDVYLYCQLLDESDERVAVLAVTVSWYDLPVLKYAPIKDTTTHSSVTIMWSEWDGETDFGDPPIVGYIPYYRKQENNMWIAGSDVSISDPLQFTFNDLESDVDYAFSVSTVREGEKGEGQQGPTLAVKTLCAGSLNGPQSVLANITGERQELVEISWEHPSNDDIRCRDGIEKFIIYYSSTSFSSNDESLMEVTNSTATSWIINGLERGAEYVFEMTLTTEGGESTRSSQTRHLVPVLPEMSTFPTLVFSNSTTITIRWTAWDETRDTGTPPVVSYNLYHKLSNDSDWREAIPYNFVNGQVEYYATVANLSPDTLYDFSIAAVREGYGGEGPKSPPLDLQRTIVCKSPPSPENVVTQILGEKQQLVEISWKSPSEGIDCSSGVTKFTVYYYSSETTKTSQVDTDPTATSLVLYNLTAGVSYTIFVTLNTAGGESDGSNEVDHLVPVLPSLANPPSLTRVTCDSVTMIWDAWTESRDPGTPPISHYIPYLRGRESSNWISGEVVTHGEPDDQYQFTFHDLKADTIYEFCVVVVREGVGEGDKTNIVKQSTAYCSASSSAPTYVIAVSVVTLAILMIFTAVFCFLRYRGRQSETRVAKGPMVKTYENAGFGAPDDYASIEHDHVQKGGSGYQDINLKQQYETVVGESTAFSGYETPIDNTSAKSRGPIKRVSGVEENPYEIPAV